MSDYGTKTRVVKSGKKRKSSFNDESEPQDPPSHRAKLAALDNQNSLKNPQQVYAGHPMYHRNWCFRKSYEIYPHDSGMRVVDWYFPYAESGPLFVDDIEKGESVDPYRIKSLKFKEHKVGRYVAMHKGKILIDENCDLVEGTN